MSGGGKEGSGSSWGSRILEGAAVVAASAVVAGGLYALLSSSSSANSELETPLSARREHKEDDDSYLISSHPKASSQVEGWKKPKIGWVKLNVDGSRDHHGHPPIAGCGGVFRDASGAWLYGFALKLDTIYEAHETELQAILVGMQLASEMKFDKLIVESDNDDVVRMVEEDKLKFKKHRREYGVVKSIRELRFDPKWQAELVSISRDANRVADSLARKACTLSSDDLQNYLSPPDGNIKSFHLKDIEQDCVSKTMRYAEFGFST